MAAVRHTGGALFDLSLPRSAQHRGAHASGFNARLAGESRYSNPYGDKIEIAQAAGRRPGWLHGLWHAWHHGWLTADELVGAPDER